MRLKTHLDQIYRVGKFITRIFNEELQVTDQLQRFETTILTIALFTALTSWMVSSHITKEPFFSHIRAMGRSKVVFVTEQITPGKPHILCKKTTSLYHLQRSPEEIDTIAPYGKLEGFGRFSSELPYTRPS